MKKILLAAIFCGVIASSCKKEDETYCYECETTAVTTDGTNEIPMPDMSMTIEECGWTEAQAKAASATVTSSAGGVTMKATTVCNKK